MYEKIDESKWSERVFCKVAIDSLRVPKWESKIVSIGMYVHVWCKGLVVAKRRLCVYFAFMFVIRCSKWPKRGKFIIKLTKNKSSTYFDEFYIFLLCNKFQVMTSTKCAKLQYIIPTYNFRRNRSLSICIRRLKFSLLETNIFLYKINYKRIISVTNDNEEKVLNIELRTLQ